MRHRWETSRQTENANTILTCCGAHLLDRQSWLNTRNTAGKLEQSARLVAESVQKYVGAVVQGKSELVRLAASRPAVLKAVKEGEPAMVEMDRVLQNTLPDVLLTRLLPVKDWSDEKIQQELFGSYAAADMYQRVHDTSATVPVEALKDKKGKVYFLIAMPVKDADQLAGVLFATFPFKLIAKGLKDLHPQGVSLKLEQDTGMSLVEAGEQGAPGQTGRIPVPGTLWHVGYANTDTVGLPLPILAGMAAGVVVLLVLALLWSYRRLQRDYQQDMGMTVTLVDATLKRLGATVQQPRLKESIPAIEMLTRYAQATRTASMNAERNENAVEQPQQFSQGIPRQQIQDHEACSMAPEKLPETLFQANLIRGLSDAELNAETAQAIGLVVGSMVQEAGAASHGERSEGW